MSRSSSTEQEAQEALISANRLHAARAAEIAYDLCEALQDEIKNPEAEGLFRLCSEKENAVAVLMKLVQVLQKLVAIEAALNGKETPVFPENAGERLLRTKEDWEIYRRSEE